MIFDEPCQHLQQRLIAVCERINPEDKDACKTLLTALGHENLLAITTSTKYGGHAGRTLEHFALAEALGMFDPGLALSYVAHSNLCMLQIERYGSEDQQARYLPALADGSAVGALAMSEHEVGSDIMNITCTATPCADHFVLDGQKMWITNAPIADILIIYARRSDTGVITPFIVERADQGLSTGEPLEKIGMLASPTGEITLEKCRIPNTRILGANTPGHHILMSGLDYERILLSAIGTGIMQKALNIIIDYSKSRTQFNKKINTFQLIQQKICHIYSHLNALRSYAFQLCQHCDERSVQRQDAASLYWLAGQQAVHAASEAIQCLGGLGYLKASKLGALLQDAKLLEIGGGTNEIRQILVGREVSK